jgi:hypothetical protein
VAWMQRRLDVTMWGAGGRPRPISDQSSSARQMVVAVQALQMSRASSIVPRGSG